MSKHKSPATMIHKIFRPKKSGDPPNKAKRNVPYTSKAISQTPAVGANRKSPMPWGSA